MRIRFVSKVLSVLGFCVLAAAVDAQSGTVAGRVTMADGTTPAAGATVTLMRGTSPVGASVITSASGEFRIANVAEGTYTVSVKVIGFEEVRTPEVTVTAGATANVTASLAERVTILEYVAITDSRGAVAQKIMDSPSPVTVIMNDRISERAAPTVAEHIKGVPGVSISQGGIAQANIVSRGFNNAFSTTMMMMQDFRFAGVPSLRVNVPFLFTGTGDDIDRIEVMQGPASALYGPNSSAGVLHLITKSPFDYPGTTITLDGGERSLLRLGARHAGTLSDKLGYKVSGEYFSANDWEYNDPNETATGMFYSASDPRLPTSRQGQRIQRDFGLERMSGEVRLDYRPTDDIEAVTTLGYSKIGKAIEITTTFGAAQVVDWSYLSFQQRFRRKRTFAQVFFNGSNSGNDSPTDDQGTFYLRSGIPVVDQSSVLVAQVQQGYDLGVTRFTGGFDYIATRPKTEGTIMGRNEDDDAINEMGAYLQMTHPINEKVDFTAALRGDVNSRIEGSQFSPRAAFVYKITPEHTTRFTYNRAFNSPASFAFFLDQWSGQRQNLGPGINPNGVTTDVQIMGNMPKHGWVYDRSCDAAVNGGLCMRSNFSGPAPVSATGANLVPGIMQGYAPALVAAIAGTFGLSPAQQAAIIADLQALSPTDANVRGVLRNLGAGNVVVPWGNVRDRAPLGANFSNTWEIGYKGLIADKLRLSVDYWYQIRPAEPTTQVINLADAVFLDPATLGAYLGAAMGPSLVANGVPAPAVPTVVGGWTGTLATIPGGLLNYDNPAYDQNYLIFTYQNGEGHVDVRGIDLGIDYVLTPFITVEGSYSWLSRNEFTKAPGATPANPLTANAPKNRATLALRFNNGGAVPTLTGELRTRYMDAMPVNSGVLNSYNIGTPTRYFDVPVGFFVDAGFSWRIPVAQNVRWGVNGQNLFNNPRPSFVGVPEIGRMITTRLQYTF